MANSRGSGFTTWQTRQIHSPRHWLGWGVTSGVRFGLAHLSNGLEFCDDFSKLTCDLSLFILESFSGFKARSFKIFWDLGRRLIIAGQLQKAFAAQTLFTSKWLLATLIARKAIDDFNVFRFSSAFKNVLCKGLKSAVKGLITANERVKTAFRRIKTC